MDKFEIIVLLVLATASILLLIFTKEESKKIKNISTVVLIVTGLLAAHYAYDNFIAAKEKRVKLPPVFNVKCTLEKVGDTDSCYWLKASVHYENKSDKRIYIIASILNITGSNIISEKKQQQRKDIELITAIDTMYFRDYKYGAGSVLYSSVSENNYWYDLNQETHREYVIKIPKGYEVASLYLNVKLANHELKDIKGYSFKNYLLEDRRIYPATLHGDTILDPKRDSSQLYKLRNEYGLCFTFGISEIYLKGDFKK